MSLNERLNFIKEVVDYGIEVITLSLNSINKATYSNIMNFAGIRMLKQS